MNIRLSSVLSDFRNNANAITTDPLVLHVAVLLTYLIPENGPYGPKHVVKIIRA
jgi:hypothetical protein